MAEMQEETVDVVDTVDLVEKEVKMFAQRVGMVLVLNLLGPLELDFAS